MHRNNPTLSIIFIVVMGLLVMLPNRRVMAQDWLYTVRPGDNLWDLTDQYLIGMRYWQPLRKLNRIDDPLHIPPGTVLRIPIRWIRKIPIIARVDAIEGQATLIEAEGGKSKTVTKGSFVFIGETIQTQANSTVSLEFIDGSKLLLQPDSQLDISNLSVYGNTGMADSRIHLNQGRLETQVEKKQGPGSHFEITTPAGVTSVRGTDYRISAEAATTRSHTEVLKGTVSVASAGEKELISGGYGTISSSSEPPSHPIELMKAVDIQAIPKLFERVPVQFTLPTDPEFKGYRVQIARTSAFDSVVFDRKYANHQIRGPELPDGDYFSRIRAIDAHGLEGKNAEFQFTINARPEAPILQEPKPTAGLIEETPGFLWARQAGIHTYHFQLARDEHFTELVVDRSDVSEAQLSSGYKLDLKQYFWRVASISAAEGQGPYSDVQTFKRLKPPPQTEAPAISDTTLVLRWPRDLPDAKYHVQIANDEAFSDLMIDKETAIPTLEIERPEAGTYYVRVSTAYPDGFSGPFGNPQIIEVPRSGHYWWLLALLPFALFAL